MTNTGYGFFFCSNHNCCIHITCVLPQNTLPVTILNKTDRKSAKLKYSLLVFLEVEQALGNSDLPYSTYNVCLKHERLAGTAVNVNPARSKIILRDIQVNLPANICTTYRSHTIENLGDLDFDLSMSLTVVSNGALRFLVCDSLLLF